MKKEETKKKSNNSYLLLALIIVAALVLLIAWRSNIFLSNYQKYYAGDVRNFRGDLTIAKDVPVYPEQRSIRDILLNPEVYRIQIAFFPNDTENSFYFASSFEITNKLGIIFRNILGSEVSILNTDDGSSCMIFYPNKQIRCFKSVPINSTDELFPTSVEPAILLLGPSKANKTAVTVENYLIIAEGQDFEETDRKYTDLDLAVDKIILVLMEYTSI